MIKKFFRKKLIIISFFLSLFPLATSSAIPGWIALVDTGLAQHNDAEVMCTMELRRSPESFLGSPFRFIHHGNGMVDGRVFILPFTKVGEICGNDFYVNPLAFIINWFIWFIFVTFISWVISSIRKDSNS